MTTRRPARVVAPVLAATMLLAGCAAGGAADPADAEFTDEATGTLAAWGFNNADDVGEARLDHAAEQLPDLEIEIDATSFDAQKFTTRVASGQVPDIVQMDRNFVATYAAQGLILPLDSCFAAHDVDPGSLWYESVVDDVTYDGGVYAVPQFFQPPAIILNQRVLDEAGVDAAAFDTSDPDALVAAVEQLYREEDGTPTRLGFDPVPAGQASMWLLAYGGSIIDDEGRPTLDDEGNLAGLDVLTRLAEAQGGYAQMKSFTDSFDTFGDGNQYVRDQVAAQINAQWYVNVLSPYVDQVDITAVPFRDADGEPFAVAGGSSFVIPARAENKDAACAWAVELTTPEAWEAAGEARAATVADTPGGIATGLFTGEPAADQSIREAFVPESGNAGFDQTIATYYDVVGSGVTIGASPAGQQIQTEVNNAVQAVLLGEKEPEQALADAQQAAMRAYDQAAG